jgi:hypothetical protein
MVRAVRKRPKARTAFVALAAGISVGLVSACSGVPDSSPVHQGKPVLLGNDYTQPDLKLLPPRPVAGETPEQIVQGFRSASADFSNNHAIARLYLTPQAAASWQPGTAVAILDDSAVPQIIPTGPGTVQFVASVSGKIGTDRAYTPEQSGTEIEDTFRLQKVDGQWRIANPPPELRLYPYEVQVAFRTATVYFLDPTQTMLVPVQEFLPVRRTDLATELVHALLRGPTVWIGPAVRTAFPSGLQLLSPVSVDSGTATVNLGAEALGVPEKQRQAMAAQITWTLQQLPEIGNVRVEVGRSPLDVGITQPFRQQAFASFNPDAVTVTPTGYYTRDGKLLQVSGRPGPGPAGQGTVALATPAIAPGRPATIGASEGLIAGLSADGTTLFAGPVEAPKPVGQADTFTAPSWDSLGNLWTVATSGGRQQVLVGPLGGSLAAVPNPELAQDTIVALRVSRDGTRVAVVVQDTSGNSKLLVGLVVKTDGGIRLAGFRDAAPGYTQVTSCGWLDANTLVGIGATGKGAVQVFTAAVDGSRVSPLAPLASPVTVAAAPGQPILAGTADGTIYSIPQGGTGSWHVATVGENPFYPG